MLESWLCNCKQIVSAIESVYMESGAAHLTVEVCFLEQCEGIRLVVLEAEADTEFDATAASLDICFSYLA